jgi:glycosyltransferase involved in cell wall biosynthesis
LGLDGHVRFLGWRDDVAQIMPVLDVFVLPSLNEGMGRVLVEAMAAGRPIVASRTGGIPDLVRHGETGLLVAPGDETGLADSISLLLSAPAMAERMGSLGRQRCREFSLCAMIAKLEDLYRRLAADSPIDGREPNLKVAPDRNRRLQAVDTGKTCLPAG